MEMSVEMNDKMKYYKYKSKYLELKQNYLHKTNDDFCMNGYKIFIDGIEDYLNQLKPTAYTLDVDKFTSLKNGMVSTNDNKKIPLDLYLSFIAGNQIPRIEDSVKPIPLIKGEQFYLLISDNIDDDDINWIKREIKISEEKPGKLFLHRNVLFQEIDSNLGNLLGIFLDDGQVQDGNNILKFKYGEIYHKIVKLIAKDFKVMKEKIEKMISNDIPDVESASASDAGTGVVPATTSEPLSPAVTDADTDAVLASENSFLTFSLKKVDYPNESDADKKTSDDKKDTGLFNVKNENNIVTGWVEAAEQITRNNKLKGKDAPYPSKHRHVSIKTYSALMEDVFKKYNDEYNGVNFIKNFIDEISAENNILIEKKPMNHSSKKDIFLLTELGKKELFFIQKKIDSNINTIYVNGDYHSSLHSFIYFLDKMKGENVIGDNLKINATHKKTMFVFCGDIVDRGVYSVELLYCIFKFKCVNWEQVIICNGNHERNDQYMAIVENEVRYGQEMKAESDTNDENDDWIKNSESSMKVLKLLP